MREVKYSFKVKRDKFHFDVDIVYCLENKKYGRGYFFNIYPKHKVTDKTIPLFKKIIDIPIVAVTRQSESKLKQIIALKEELVEKHIKEFEELLDAPSIETYKSDSSSRKLAQDKKVDIYTSFAEIAGLKEVKDELLEIADYITDREKYDRMNVKLPKGVLLYGPPGTGKTLIAKALAKATDTAFFYVSGSEFVEKYVGVGAKRVRTLFEKARAESPSIVFIDEIDSVGIERSKDGNNQEKDQTLNQLLTELDGFKEDESIIVIGSTNRIDLLDKALLRAGRFDRHIYIGAPDLESRKELFRIHTKNKPLNNDVDLDLLAKKTHGFTGADIANITNEAGLLAIRENQDTISQKFLDKAIEKCIGGLASKTTKLLDNEKNIVSYHEAGHAVANLLLDVNTSIEKISIIPHGKSLGFVINLPKEDRFLYKKDDLLNQIKVLLAGKASEDIIFKTHSTGIKDDLNKANKIALDMVSKYAMGDDGSLFYLNSDISKQEEKADKLLKRAYKEIKLLLEDNIDLLEYIATTLYEKEEITMEDLNRLNEFDIKVACTN